MPKKGAGLHTIHFCSRCKVGFFSTSCPLTDFQFPREPSPVPGKLSTPTRYNQSFLKHFAHITYYKRDKDFLKCHFKNKLLSFNLQFVKLIGKMSCFKSCKNSNKRHLSSNAQKVQVESQLMSQFTLKFLGGLPIRYV